MKQHQPHFGCVFATQNMWFGPASAVCFARFVTHALEDMNVSLSCVMEGMQLLAFAFLQVRYLIDSLYVSFMDWLG